MDMSLNYEEGKRVILKGMTKKSPRVGSTKCMEAIFRHGDLAYATECLVVTQNIQEKNHSYSHDI